MRIDKQINQEQALANWISKISTELALGKHNLYQLAGDASVRKYYLLSTVKYQYIVMQTPIDSSMTNFIKISNLLSSLNLRINVPRILAVHSEHPIGFMLLSYLGEKLLFKHLKLENAKHLYAICLDRISSIQLKAKDIELPKMDRDYIRTNLTIYKDWYLARHLGISPDPKLQSVLDSLEDCLVQVFSAQPQVLVHLDYHSKNIMLDPTDVFDPQQYLGILDFQDAMSGPITYDIASLLQDAYMVFPVKLIEEILLQHYDYLLNNHPQFDLSKKKFLEYFYLTGLQRHLKNLGVFARLKYHYHKPQYIDYIPNLMNYIHYTCKLLDKPELVSLKILCQLMAGR